MIVSLGIDVGLTKGLNLVGLNYKNEITFIRTFKPWDPVTFLKLVSTLKPEIICIDAPSGWAEPGKKSRCAERRLKREYKIQSFYTPSEEHSQSSFYDWVRRGQEIFKLLEPNHPVFKPRIKPPFSCEVFPNATARLLADPHNETSPKEKVKYRSTVLNKFIDDITSLKTLDDLDAALAALTGNFILSNHYSALGAEKEGYLIIPEPTANSTS